MLLAGSFPACILVMLGISDCMAGLACTADDWAGCTYPVLANMIMSVASCHVQIQDKVAFLMNNVSPDNLTSKAAELGKLLPTEHWNWFVNYLVVRRAAQVGFLSSFAGCLPNCYLWHLVQT